MARRKPTRNTANSGQAVAAAQRAAFSRYLEAEVGASPNTVDAYSRDVDRFLAWLRETNGPDVTMLTLQTLSAYLRYLTQSGRAATSTARALVSVKMFLRYLQLEGFVEKNAAELLDSPKLWKHLPTVLSTENVNRLLSEPNADDRHHLRDRAVLNLMYATGARASEVCGISLQAVSLEQHHVRLFGKGRKERVVSLTPAAVLAIEAYVAKERPTLVASETEILFLSRTGRPLSRMAIWDLVKKYAARIGCAAAVSPHTLRHSFATHMLAGGAEIRALQELLGHASIRTTQVYTQVDSSRMKSVHAACHPRG